MPRDETNTTLSEATNRFRAFLHSHRLRLTRERIELLQTALGAKGHFDAEGLFANLRRRTPGVSRATTYRTLTLLEQCGILRRALVGRGRSFYERAIDRGHHDHLVCAACGRIDEFYDPTLEAIQKRIAVRRGFAIDRYIHELHGTCRACRNGRSSKSDADDRKNGRGK
jgi:Fur family transcriptional regulator, ferric uptake regulator